MNIDLKTDKPHSRGDDILVRSCATPPGICQENMFSLGGVAQLLDFITLSETCTMQHYSVFELLLRGAIVVAPAVGCSFQSCAMWKYVAFRLFLWLLLLFCCE